MSVMNSVISNVARIFLLTAIIYLLSLHYEKNRETLSSSLPAQEQKQLEESGLPPNSKPKFSGDNYWSAEDQEMCDNPEMDKTWMKSDSLCFMENRSDVVSKIEVISWTPTILHYRGMFSQEQVANWLHMYNQQQIETLETVDSRGNPSTSKFRVSDGAKTAKEDFPEADDLAITAAKHIPALNFENTEAIVGVTYQPGGHYSRHYDYFDFEDGVRDESVMTLGNRLVTVVMMFQKAESGGGTMFPLLHTTVRAEPGDAIVFLNMRKNGEMEKLIEHAGCPVRSGQKIIATVWLRSKEQPILKEGNKDPKSFHASVLLH